MSVVATRSYTVEEYLELDAEADDERYELQHGSVIPGGGAEPEHNQVKVNVSSEWGNRLVQRGCFVMTSDQRVRVSFGYVYPDVIVTCDPTYEDTRPPDPSEPGTHRGSDLGVYGGARPQRQAGCVHGLGQPSRSTG